MMTSAGEGQKGAEPSRKEAPEESWQVRRGPINGSTVACAVETGGVVLTVGGGHMICAV